MKWKLLFLLSMIIPFMVNAETCDTDKIAITSITFEEKSDGVTELDDASAAGKDINLNLSMTEVGDSIKYKINVKNDSNDDYEFDKSFFNMNSGYINYTFSSEGNSTIIKSNSDKTFFLTVEYKNQVPNELLSTGKFTDSNTINVNLSSGNGVSNDTLNNQSNNKTNTKTENPKTGIQTHGMILMILVLSSGVTLIILRRKGFIRYMILIMGVSVLIPLSVYAICKCNIKIYSNIEIVKKANPKLCYINTGNPWQKVTFEYLPDDTFEEYVNRNRNNPDNISEDFLLYYDYGGLGYMPNECFTFDTNNIVQTDWICFQNNISNTFIDKDGNIKSEEEGCYLYID